MTSSRFRPFPLLPGGHLQTLGGFLLRAPLRWRLPVEDVVVEGEEGVRILLRASFHADGERPLLLLIHGLEGCDSAPYMISTGALAWASGWNVVRMNMRGCGDSLKLCPRLYNAGLTLDVIAVLHVLARRFPRIGITGFSLGGNLSLLTLARERHRLPEEVKAAVAVCPPLEMSLCADAMERPSNRIYQLRFVRSLLSSYRNRQRLLPAIYNAGRERGLTTIRAFDDVITAFYGGYQDAEDYYGAVSPGGKLTAIDRPTLVLATANDPFVPTNAVNKWARPENVEIEILESGGHVGFVGPSRAPGYFWAAERALSFLENAVQTSSQRLRTVLVSDPQRRSRR
ncbi:MAG: YheT family hydrolase [Vicinamibacteria bacterium]